MNEELCVAISTLTYFPVIPNLIWNLIFDLFFNSLFDVIPLKKGIYFHENQLRLMFCLKRITLDSKSSLE